MFTVLLLLRVPLLILLLLLLLRKTVLKTLLRRWLKTLGKTLRVDLRSCGGLHHLGPSWVVLWWFVLGLLPLRLLRLLLHSLRRWRLELIPPDGRI